jgi:hypothetical protein
MINLSQPPSTNKTGRQPGSSKRITKRRLLLLLLIPLLAIPFLFPFRERADFRKQQEEYNTQVDEISESVTAVTPPPPASNDIARAVASGSPDPDAETDPVRVSNVPYPAQPLGPPYPNSWPELLDWIGPPEKYTGSRIGINQSRSNSGIYFFREFMEEYKNPVGAGWTAWIDTPGYSTLPLVGRKTISKNTYSQKNKHDQIPTFDDRERATIARLVTLSQTGYEKLHQYENANGIFFGTDLTTEDFHSSSAASLRGVPTNYDPAVYAGGALRNTYETLMSFDGATRRGNVTLDLLYLVAAHYSHSGEVEKALDSIRNMIRLAEHWSASWNLYTYEHVAHIIDYPVRAVEYLLHHQQLTSEQLTRLAQWTQHMERRFDYGNVLAGMQIIAQQIWVLHDDRFHINKIDVDLNHDSGFVDEIQAMWETQQENMANTKAGRDLFHKRFLMSRHRYACQTLVLDACMKGHESRKKTEFLDAVGLIPRALPIRNDDDEFLEFIEYITRANRVNQMVWQVIEHKYNVVANLRLIRAACILETFKLQTGAYPKTLDEACRALQMDPPLDNLTEEPLKVDFENDRYLIRANRALDDYYRLRDPLYHFDERKTASKIKSGEQHWMEFQFLKLFQ